MTSVKRIIGNISGLQKQVAKKLPNAVVAGSNVEIHSPLDRETDLNQHIVWLWGLLKHERRYIKRLASEGATISCVAKVKHGKATLKPNGSEMLHLLGIDLILSI